MSNMTIHSRTAVFLNPQDTGEVPRFISKDGPLNASRKTAFDSMRQLVESVGKSAGLTPNNKSRDRGERTHLLEPNTVPELHVPVKIDKDGALKYLDELKELISIVQTKMNDGGGYIESYKAPVFSSTRDDATTGVNSTLTAEKLLAAVEKICAHRYAPLKTKKLTLSSCFGPNYTGMAETILKLIDTTKKTLQELPLKEVRAPRPGDVQLQQSVEGSSSPGLRRRDNDVDGSSRPYNDSLQQTVEGGGGIPAQNIPQTVESNLAANDASPLRTDSQGSMSNQGSAHRDRVHLYGEGM